MYTEIQNIQWLVIDDTMYCADGDGLVVVEKVHDHMYVVTDQGEAMSTHIDLDEAIARASEILKEHYPEVYEEVFSV